MNKKWYLSKTVWVALFALVATFSADAFGYEIPASYQTAFLAVVMFVLRMITKEPVSW